MNVSFLFPGGSRYDALSNWVNVLSRHSGKYNVRLTRSPYTMRDETDVYFLLTECFSYPQQQIDFDIRELRRVGKRFAVVHNNDSPGYHYSEPRPLPTPGDYPSFCWTEQALKKLEAYKPTLVRQPVLPFLMDPKERRPHIGTFGYAEPKKGTLEMAQWAQGQGIPFTAFCPDVSSTWCPSRQKLHHDYVADINRAGGKVVMHPWLDRVEDLAALVDDISHFLFLLPKSKGGSGGSPTSPRYATAFARPVIVIDDERTLLQDGVYVFDDMASIAGLADMKLPSTAWGPEQYIDELVSRTV